jgi:hypothetical protein
MKISTCLSAILALLLWAGQVSSQAISGRSTAFKFEYGKQGRISGTSKLFTFNVSAMDKMRATSRTLKFGMTGEVEKTQVIVQSPQPEPEKEVRSEPVTVAEQKTEEPRVENPQPKIETPAVVATETAVIANETRSVEPSQLGSEYTDSNMPTYRALIIGISDYKHKGTDGPVSLDKPVKDARSLYNVLTTRYTFNPDHVTVLENPTRGTIIDAFELLAANLTEKDNLLIFYAGHGYFDKNNGIGYWLPSDAKINSRGDWLSTSSVKEYLGAIKTKHSLLITDACFGGSIFKSRAVDSYTLLKVYQLYRDPSRKAITSGNLTEVPDESPFLQQLLKKLEDNEDDYLPSHKLFTRIYEPVTDNSTAEPQYGVVQGVGDQGGDFIFMLRKKK